VNDPATQHVQRDVVIVPVVLLVTLGTAVAVLGAPDAGAPYLGRLPPQAAWQAVAGVQVLLAGLVLPLARCRARDALPLCVVGLPLEAFTMAGSAGVVDPAGLGIVRVMLLSQVLVATVARHGVTAGRLRDGEAVLGPALLLIGLPVAGGLVEGVTGEWLAELSPLAGLRRPAAWPVAALAGQLGLAVVLRFAGCWRVAR
jgi:hypothetical protein